MANIFCIRPKGFNIGNEVIYQGTLALLRQTLGPQVNVIALPATSRYESQAVAGLSPRTVHEINQYGHGVVVGGGNLFENGELQVDRRAIEALQVPLFLFSLSHGRIYNRRHELVRRTDALDDDIIRLLHERSRYCLTRDQRTTDYLQSLGCSTAQTGGCPTLFLRAITERIPTFLECPQVLFSVRTPELMNIPLADQARVRSDVLRIVDLLRRRGYESVKLLCHDHRDLGFAASFDALEYLYTDDVFTFLGWLRSCRLSIGYRLHAVIPSLSLGTPTIGIDYDERSISLMDTIGLADWSINMMAADDVVEAVKERIAQLERLSDLKELATSRWNALHDVMLKAFGSFADDVHKNT